MSRAEKTPSIKLALSFAVVFAMQFGFGCGARVTFDGGPTGDRPSLKFPPLLGEWHLPMLDAAIESGEVNKVLDNGYTPLTMALVLQRVDRAIVLLDLGADADQVDDWGYVPLHLAIVSEMDEVVGRILEERPDVNRRGHGIELTALHYAAVLDNIELLCRLLQMGADPNLRSNAGAPLSYVQTVEAARILIDHGASLQVGPAEHGPLHSAAGTSLELVRFLIERGADPTIANHHGHTPADIARMWGLEDVAEYLDSLR